MTYDILIQLRGERYAAHHLKTVRSEQVARDLVRDLTNLPAGTIHYVITCEDGSVIHDSSKDGIIR